MEWNFLFKVLKEFNFGKDFILYYKPIFKIKNTGWISKTCNMNRGIRQMCPISVLLYFFVAKILSLKRKSNHDKNGKNISNIQKVMKNIQPADDFGTENY